ncbi:hypothetical protein OV203_47525 [Nannocystis sp. ILAH1]|uniref:hypothetical protein n=1 Tax=Nannocystis sp. ILAH1 TaxID=2996789 RepID=UPI00227074BF|nr:hypothetical protein [Nannocystis sp. ILAH1]MCY0994870.1 hypothetical protein [Nannocystis sp. ILAH1]
MGLPTPGTDEIGRRVEGVELQRLVRGNLLEAMGTELFGEDVGRSEAGRKDVEELAKLNRLATQGKLTAEQKRRRAQLQAQIPTRANSAVASGEES